MPRFDLPPHELARYRPDIREPEDFDAFWQSTLAGSRQVGGEILVSPVDSPMTAIDVFDVTFPGFAGDPVKAWLWAPRGATGPLPTIIEYNGYGGGRGLPHERLAWAASGYAHLFMDTRGQGSAWGSGGATADPHGTGASAPGFMTRGIDDPEGYYYRRLFTDAVRLVDAARTLGIVDAHRVAVTGVSQGGGVAIAAAALAEDVAAVMPDVPFLCHFERAVGLTDHDPYAEIVRYLRVHRGSEEQVFDTLSYFDGATFAARIYAPALFSVGLHDLTCPPSTVYAAYNHLASETREIDVYPFNEHEGGQAYRWPAQAAFAAAHL
ncbi:acetylxylan esterase [Microbacterium aquimaris]|uniref:acetylxylan esterase n=1 Tax=Microbacterium aquimaris TaxID=459816 RepID=UPI002AD5AE17|nr:acetylxylan esterase [Microbacterium aquimaris]MDZ8274645.1 acetylxylan esterase [Microbacterium aquimaris]